MAKGEAIMEDSSFDVPHRWRKVAYGGMQPGDDDNHTDDSFLSDRVTNANVIQRDLFRVMCDSVGFLILLFTSDMISLYYLGHYVVYCMIGLYALSPIYHTPTRSISSDTIWAPTAMLIVLHLFLHDYTSWTVKAPGFLVNPTLRSNSYLNTAIVASVLIVTRLPSMHHVFAMVSFSLQAFHFGPLVTYCLKRFSFHLHLWFSIGLMVGTLVLVYR